MKDILIFCAGAQARVAIDMIEQGTTYQVAGIIDERVDPKTKVNGHTILSNQLDQHLLSKYPRGIVALGDNWQRQQLVNRITQVAPSFQFITLLHPSAVISPRAEVGPGTIVMAGTIINNDTTIGKHSIVNTGSTIDHDCRMEDFVSIGPGCSIGGSVNVSHGSAVALGVNIIHDRTIGAHTVVGAGSTVIRDIPSYSMAYGTPAKVIRKRTTGEPYLT